MYEPPRQEEERPGCRDTLVLTRAVFAVLLPPLMAILGVLTLVVVALILLAASSIMFRFALRWYRSASS